MTRSFTSRPNAQAVLDLYGHSDRLQIVAALNEDRRRHRLADALRRTWALVPVHRGPAAASGTMPEWPTTRPC